MLLTYKKVHIFVYGLFFFLIACDQLIKYLIVHFDLVSYYCNTGIAFGVEIHYVVFIIAWLGIVGFVFYFWWMSRKDSLFVQIPFILILAGGFGNIIDRIIYGCVIDYVPFLTISTFNFADTLISFGAFLWVRHAFVKKHKNIDE